MRPSCSSLSPVLGDDVEADVHALVTDVDGREPADQLADVPLALLQKEHFKPSPSLFLRDILGDVPYVRRLVPAMDDLVESAPYSRP
jgi:hypothetical protein